MEPTHEICYMCVFEPKYKVQCDMYPGSIYNMLSIKTSRFTNYALLSNALHSQQQQRELYLSFLNRFTYENKRFKRRVRSTNGSATQTYAWCVNSFLTARRLIIISRIKLKLPKVVGSDILIYNILWFDCTTNKCRALVSYTQRLFVCLALQQSACRYRTEPTTMQTDLIFTCICSKLI